MSLPSGVIDPLVPANFAHFFLATAGAGGALIGLLFVAISISPERIFSEDAPRERQALASGVFTALVNAFFWREHPRVFASPVRRFTRMLTLLARSAAWTGDSEERRPT